MKESIKSIVVLTAVCLVAAAGLSYVNKLTWEARHPAISPKLVKSLDLLLPAHDNDLKKDVMTIAERKYYVAKKDSKVVAYAFEALNDQGYGGEVKLLLVVNPAGEMLASAVTAMKETPGLGTKVDGAQFKDQFKGKGLKNAVFGVKKDGGDIVQISGATISSRAFSAACLDGLWQFHADILKEKLDKAALQPKPKAPGVGPSVAVTAVQLKAALPEHDNDPSKESFDVAGTRYYAAKKSGKVAGYGVYAFGNGFGDRIEVVVGITLDGAVTGVVVLVQSETPGYGKEALEGAEYWQRFIGKNLGNANWAVKADGGDFDQIKGSVSSATISSRGSVEAVKKALDAFTSNRDAVEKAAAAVTPKG